MSFRAGLGRIARDARLRRTTQRLAGTDEYSDYVNTQEWVGISSADASVSASAKVSLAAATSSQGFTVSTVNDNVTVSRAGIYLVSVSGTVSSSSASKGDILRIRLTKNDVSTTWYGQRDQSIVANEYGGEPQYPAENVSFTCVVSCEVGDTLAAINDSSSAIGVGAFVFTAVRVSTSA